jgi:hypothetical protein
MAISHPMRVSIAPAHLPPLRLLAPFSKPSTIFHESQINTLMGFASWILKRQNLVPQAYRLTLLIKSAGATGIAEPEL